MTRFEKDLKKALEGEEIAVITCRSNEIISLKKELGKCNNSFRSHCIAQDIVRLEKELKMIENKF